MTQGPDGLIDFPRVAAASGEGARAKGVEPGAPSLPAAQADVPPAPRGFDTFVRTQYTHLVRFLTRRTGTLQDAEDLAQESFTRLLRYREATAASADWQPLLYRIAVNASHDHARLNAPYRGGSHLDVEASQVADEAPTPEEQTHRAQQRERLREAILALPPKCQQVWLLRNAQGMSRAQIARLCGISETMVKKHLARALHHIQRQVSAGDGEPL